MNLPSRYWPPGIDLAWGSINDIFPRPLVSRDNIAVIAQVRGRHDRIYPQENHEYAVRYNKSVYWFHRWWVINCTINYPRFHWGKISQCISVTLCCVLLHSQKIIPSQTWQRKIYFWTDPRGFILYKSK